MILTYQLKHYLLVIIFLFIMRPLLLAQKPDYDAASKYDIPNLRGKTGTDKINPFFFQGSDKFWFFFEDTTGKNYYWIDPAKGKRYLLYDRKAILRKLNFIRNEIIDSTVIMYNLNFNIPANKETVGFSYKGTRYNYNFYTHNVSEAPIDNPGIIKQTVTGNLSPDHNWRLYTRKHNLYLKNSIDTAEIPLSVDAGPYHSFSLNESDSVGNRDQASGAVWCANSKNFYILRKDNRKVKPYQ